MLSAPRSVVVRAGGERFEAPLSGPGAVTAGPLEVEVVDRPDGAIGWRVANRGDDPCPVDAVAVAFDVAAPAGPMRMFVNGHQSWTPTGTRVLGLDVDPSRTPGTIRTLRATHHADPAIAAEGELRSELVTVLAPSTGPLICVGFEGGWEHDGTVRVRPSPAGAGGAGGAGSAGGVELLAEAWLGGAVLTPGEQRTLHPIVLAAGDDHSALLEAWAARAGRAGGARTASPYQVGWCSWYHYFHGVTEEHLRSNLALAHDWPFELFQLDDGYQAAIGDWLLTNDKFPSPVEKLAAAIADAGRRPGIWLAPFMAAPASRVAANHPAWLARWVDGERELISQINPEWGGEVWTLDTTRPEVQAHLERLARLLVEAGYTYLKLDFLYAAGLPGRWHDPGATPAQRVREGLAAIRRGAGPDTFLLACGCPLGPAVGVVDGMRIGPDVAPAWAPSTWLPGYREAAPSTENAWRNTLARSFMHRRLWLNDPDCVMLRTSETGLGEEAARAWALAVGVSGGMALVSDDLALLDDGARRLLDEVLDIGRQADAASVDGPPPRCDDLLLPALPARLSVDGLRLVADPSIPTAGVERTPLPS